jgi:hypothetical protein
MQLLNKDQAIQALTDQAKPNFAPLAVVSPPVCRRQD